MIMTAATYCKVDVVKFQKRCNKELLTPEEYNAPHPHPENSYGKTYGKHLIKCCKSLKKPTLKNTPNPIIISSKRTVYPMSPIRMDKIEYQSYK